MRKRIMKRKLSQKARLDRIYAFADQFADEMDKAGMCAHEQADACAVTLGDSLRWLMDHHGIEAVDDILSQFVSTLSACTEPCDKNDSMTQLKISLHISTNESV
jgi:hypothetical protein